MPKTAGTSFKKFLAEHYKDNLHTDNQDQPLQYSNNQRYKNVIESFEKNFSLSLSEKFCIHGHFMPLKYIPLLLKYNDIHFVTWLRHPINRLMSHYNYWMKNKENAASNRLWERVVKENWSFEKFSLSDELSNIYEKYLFGFPLKLMSFIGKTENYANELRRFTRIFPEFTSKIYTENLDNGTLCPDYRDKIDPLLLEKIQKKHAWDIALYESLFP